MSLTNQGSPEVSRSEPHRHYCSITIFCPPLKEYKYSQLHHRAPDSKENTSKIRKFLWEVCFKSWAQVQALLIHRLWHKSPRTYENKSNAYFLAVWNRDSIWLLMINLFFFLIIIAISQWAPSGPYSVSFDCFLINLFSFGLKKQGVNAKRGNENDHERENLVSSDWLSKCLLESKLGQTKARGPGPQSGSLTWMAGTQTLTPLLSSCSVNPIRHLEGKQRNRASKLTLRKRNGASKEASSLHQLPTHGMLPKNRMHLHRPHVEHEVTHSVHAQNQIMPTNSL